MALICSCHFLEYSNVSTRFRLTHCGLVTPCGDIPSGQKSRSTLGQVMACCLMAPSHYLNQCWLIIGQVLWHSVESNFMASAQAVILRNEFEKLHFQNYYHLSQGQWVKCNCVYTLLSIKWQYCKTSCIGRTKFQNLNVSCILMQLSSLNPLKPGVKLRMKM